MALRRLYSGDVLVLGAVSFIEALAFSIPFSYFPDYALSLGASVASIGLFTSSFMAASALLSPKIGSVSDKIGRKRIMLWGLFGDVIFGALTGLVPTWHWLLVIRTLNGAVTAAATLPAEALLIDKVPVQRRGEALGFVSSCAIIGRNVGPAFGGSTQFIASQFLDEISSYRIPYFVDAAFAVVAVILVAWKITEKTTDTQKQGLSDARMRPDAPSSPSETKIKVQYSRAFKILLVTAFANGIALGFILPLIALFFQDKFGLEPIMIGSVMTAAGLVGLLASWIAGRISDKLGRKPMIAIGGFSSRFCGFVLPFTGDVGQATLFLSIRSLGFNIFMPAMQGLRADLVPKEVRGRLFGLYNTFFTAGDIVGPIVSTLLYDLYRFTSWNIGGLSVPGYGIPFYVNSILGIITTAILLVYVQETVDVKPRGKRAPVGIETS
ncbi:MAG TPA: MFS transporter [Candidatus Bathyarchaeia archaeon]|nr:MFS transporter [Candidatus Bathyarchaeia archaeon]